MKKLVDKIENTIVFVPNDFQESKSYNAIFFAHGEGESGTDLSILGTKDKGGLIDRLDSGNLELPYIIVCPQSVNSGTWKLTTAINSILEITLKFNINKWRNATGLSLGGIMVGQIFMNMRQEEEHNSEVMRKLFPSLFDSFYVVAGYPPYNMNIEDKYALKDKHIYFIHGEKDTKVQTYKTIARNTVLQRDDVELTTEIIPNAEHTIWEYAYSDKKYVQWLKDLFPEDFDIILETPELEVIEGEIYDFVGRELKDVGNDTELIYTQFPNPRNLRLVNCTNLTFKPTQKVLELKSYGGHTNEGTGDTCSFHGCHNIHLDGSAVPNVKYGLVISGEKANNQQMNSKPVGYGRNSTGYFKLNHAIVKDSHHALIVVKNDNSNVPINLIVLHHLLCVRGGGEGHYIGSSTSNHPIKKMLIHDSFFINMQWDGSQCKDVIEGLIENCIYLNSGIANQKNQQNGFNLINCKNLLIRNVIMSFGSLWGAFINNSKDDFLDGKVIIENSLISDFKYGIYLNRNKLVLKDCYLLNIEVPEEEGNAGEFLRAFTEIQFINCKTNKNIYKLKSGKLELLKIEGLIVDETLPQPEYKSIEVQGENEVYEVGFYGELGMGVPKDKNTDPSKYKDFIERKVEENNKNNYASDLTIALRGIIKEELVKINK